MIKRDMTIEDILSGFPEKASQLAEAISQAGLHCTSCDAASWETLEAGMLSHGMDDAKIDGLVDILNQTLNEAGPPADTITLTTAAADKYRAILKAENKEGWGLHFSERAAGCSGFEYALDYSEKADDEHTVFESEGIKIHVPNASVDRLLGCKIDYTEGLKGSGFKITNPNVKSGCGCGSSHGY